MANALISLLDLTKRTGCDQAIGLVEDVTTFAPELNSIRGRVISGTTYRAARRSALPTVSFRQANNGSDTVKSSYEQILGQCFLIDAQLQTDKAVADSEAKANAMAGQEVGLGDILADEAEGVLKGAMITIGDQFYRGTAADANGFVGLKSIYDQTNMEVDSGGTPGAATSAWLVWENIQGVHFVFGNAQGIDMMPEWRVQQVNGANSKPMTAYVNNLQAWIGLAVNHDKAVGRIKNLTAAKPLTDALIAQLKSKFPLQMRQGMKLFMNRNAAFYLQNSRSAVTTALTGSTALTFAPEPVESNGIPITVTDSIPTNE